MKLINAKAHGVLDYLVVLLFLAAPSLFHLSAVPAAISYSLAGIHLALTLLTDFPLGLVKVIPLKWHGVIELIVAPCLVALPFVLSLTAEPAALYFYAANGVVLFIVWCLTDYSKRN